MYEIDWVARRRYWSPELRALLRLPENADINTDTDLMFAESLPWRQRAMALKADFPQFQDLLVGVIDAKEPEEADATAAALTRR